MSRETAADPRTTRELSFWVELRRRVQRYPEIGAFIGFLVVFMGFVITAEKFLTFENLGGVMSVTAELGITAVGVTFLMISGEFDLSVGSVIAIAALGLVSMSNAGVPMFVAFIITMVGCAFIGWINATLVVQTRIPSFIATLGGMMFWRGMVLAATTGFFVGNRGAPTLLMQVFNGRIAQSDFFMSIVWFVLIAIVAAVILTQTKYGNAVYATGGDAAAARALGVNVARTKMINFMMCSMLAGFTGIVQFSRFSTVPPTLGEGAELEAIAAAVIGGTLLTGGYGSIIGTLLGALMMGMVRSGLVLSGAPPYWYRAFIGLILVAAVIINTKVRGK